MVGEGCVIERSRENMHGGWEKGEGLKVGDRDDEQGMIFEV